MNTSNTENNLLVDHQSENISTHNAFEQQNLLYSGAQISDKAMDFLTTTVCICIQHNAVIFRKVAGGLRRIIDQLRVTCKHDNRRRRLMHFFVFFLASHEFCSFICIINYGTKISFSDSFRTFSQ